jgi:dTDP-4-dehydrorhamnose 3,5-epimerase
MSANADKKRELIYGVQIKELRMIPDERGWLMEILRHDDDIFAGFGQAYLTTVYPDGMCLGTVTK